MPFELAQERLKQYGAVPTMFQVALSSDAAGRKEELHYFRLTSGVVMEIISERTQSRRIVASISISTYVPESCSSKMDPEQEKFFQSFVSLRVYDLHQ